MKIRFGQEEVIWSIDWYKSKLNTEDLWGLGQPNYSNLEDKTHNWYNIFQFLYFTTEM